MYSLYALMLNISSIWDIIPVKDEKFQAIKLLLNYCNLIIETKMFSLENITKGAD